MFAGITNFAKVAAVKASRFAYNYGPTAMTITGCALAVTGAVMAVKESVTTNKDGDDVVTEVNEYKKELKAIDESAPKGVEAVKEKALTTLQLGKKLFKRYLWTIILEVAAVGLIFGSYKMVVGRLSAAGAMVTSLTEQMQQLEKRVVDNTDPETAEKILTDKVTKTVETKDEATGETKTEEKEEKVPFSGYAFPYYIEISEEKCPKLAFVGSNRAEAINSIKNILAYENVITIPKAGGIMAYEFMKDLGYSSEALASIPAKEKEYCHNIGKMNRKGTEPSSPLTVGFEDNPYVIRTMNEWVNGYTDCFYICPNWDGWVSNRL